MKKSTTLLIGIILLANSSFMTLNVSASEEESVNASQAETDQEKITDYNTLYTMFKKYIEEKNLNAKCYIDADKEKVIIECDRVDSQHTFAACTGFIDLYRVNSSLYDLKVFMSKPYLPFVTGTETKTFSYGDPDRNGFIDLSDLTMLSQYLLKDIELDREQLAYVDVNADNEVNLQDISLLKQYIMHDEVKLGFWEIQHVIR